MSSHREPELASHRGCGWSNVGNGNGVQTSGDINVLLAVQ